MSTHKHAKAGLYSWLVGIKVKSFHCKLFFNTCENKLDLASGINFLI